MNPPILQKLGTCGKRKGGTGHFCKSGFLPNANPGKGPAFHGPGDRSPPVVQRQRDSNGAKGDRKRDECLLQ